MDNEVKGFICHYCRATFDLEITQHGYDVSYCPYCGRTSVTQW